MNRSQIMEIIENKFVENRKPDVFFNLQELIYDDATIDNYVAINNNSLVFTTSLENKNSVDFDEKVAVFERIYSKFVKEYFQDIKISKRKTHDNNYLIEAELVLNYILPNQFYNKEKNDTRNLNYDMWLDEVSAAIYKMQEVIDRIDLDTKDDDDNSK